MVCNENAITYEFHCIPLQYHAIVCDGMEEKYHFIPLHGIAMVFHLRTIAIPLQWYGKEIISLCV
jgi:hypothetical protein